MGGNWFTQFVNTYKSGISHTFLFNFNVRDYVDNKREMERYIYDEFLAARKFGLVVGYDVSRGLTFPDDAMEREFRKVATNGAPIPPTTLPSKVFGLLDVALCNTKTALFVSHAEMLVPSGGTAGMSGEERAALIWLCEWSLSARVSAVGSLVCLSAGNIAAVAQDLLSSSYKVEPILVGLPDEEERLGYIRAQLAAKPVKLDIPEREFAMLSSGLSKKSIRDIMLKSEAEESPVSFEFIKEKKHSVLQKEYGDVLEFIYPEIGFEDIGGMEAAKTYLTKNVIEPIRKNDLRRVPMGILLCGPSGTGKTLLVYAIARASGFNCVKIDMARILGQYVGESEKNFKKCLLGAQSQQPVIVFVDEIDTAFKRGDERDSGVSRNIFSEFLQFTGNTKNRGKVIFMAATNRPDMLDPALKRAGRFDKKIPILLPSASERAQVLGVLVRKYKFATDVPDFAPFAQQTRGYTGAELEVVLRKAYELACQEQQAGGAGGAGAGVGDAPEGEGAAPAGSVPAGATPPEATPPEAVISERHLAGAIERCRPNTGQIEMMTQLAIDECDDSDLLEREDD
jgi:SpoVK/Ycf46/Vps4 family AAA+-type ATPase